MKPPILLIIIIVILCAAFFLVVLMFTPAPAQAHSWFTGTTDPVWMRSCCGGNDCGLLPEASLNVTAQGYHVVLTVDQAREINHGAMLGIDAIVPWNLAQPSPDGKYYICIYPESRRLPDGGVICFFAPLNA